MSTILLIVAAFIVARLVLRTRAKRYIGTYLMALIALTLTISMVRFPDEAFASALHGLKVWWEIVFPALLPFFIGSEILMGLGVVNFMGVLLEPIMRPLFNVPGVGSFVMAIGLASGFPIGAILTGKLRRQNMCNKVEAERLIAFTNTADPLFMIGAVAVGMFGDARLGIIIAAAHYLSALVVGLVMRFHGRNQPNSVSASKNTKGNIVYRALYELYDARQKDGRAIGQLLGDAIRNSVNSLLLIGGFIILFSVVIRIATVAGIVTLLAQAFNSFFRMVGLSTNLSDAAISGLFEITIGCNVASQAVAPLAQRIILTSSIIAWSGLSVHAQVASLVNDTDINMAPYLFGRALHAVLAGVFTWLLWDRLAPTWQITLPVFLYTPPAANVNYWVGRLAFTSTRMALFLCGLLIVSLAYHAVSRLRIIIWRR